MSPHKKITYYTPVRIDYVADLGGVVVRAMVLHRVYYALDLTRGVHGSGCR